MSHDIVRNIDNNTDEISIYFPKEYSLNIPFHRYYHECSARIPRFDYNIVKSFIKKCKFSSSEIERSIINNVFVKKVLS